MHEQLILEDAANSLAEVVAQLDSLGALVAGGTTAPNLPPCELTPRQRLGLQQLITHVSLRIAAEEDKIRGVMGRMAS